MYLDPQSVCDLLTLVTYLDPVSKTSFRRHLLAAKLLENARNAKRFRKHQRLKPSLRTVSVVAVRAFLRDTAHRIGKNLIGCAGFSDSDTLRHIISIQGTIYVLILLDFSERLPEATALMLLIYVM